MGVIPKVKPFTDGFKSENLLEVGFKSETYP